MEIIEFYGRTIRVKDISFCEKRRTRTSEVVSIIWKILGILGILGILLGIYFYDISTHIYDIFGINVDIQYSHILIFLVVYAIVYKILGFIIDDIFDADKILLIVLFSGERIESSYISDADASLLKTHIYKILRGKKTCLQ